jgi:hypothetical protein
MCLENFSRLFADHDFCSQALKQLDVPCQPGRRHADDARFSKTSQIQLTVTFVQLRLGITVGIQFTDKIVGELRTPLLNPMFVKSNTLRRRHPLQRNGREISNGTIRSKFLRSSTKPALYNSELPPLHFLKPILIYSLPEQLVAMSTVGPHKMGLDVCPGRWPIQVRQYIFNLLQCFTNITIVLPLIMFFCPCGHGLLRYVTESEILKQIGFRS